MKLILLEDDALIRACTEDALAAAGFEVLAAMSAEEALALLAETSDVLGMVIDVRLSAPPDGWVVARQARRMHPAIEIIYTTTAGRSAYESNAVDRSIFLEKPYTLDHAVAAARNVVAQAQRASGSVPDPAKGRA
jgi:DNA-binding NtrC family response regulator